MITTINHSIQVKTRGCEVETSDAHSFETKDFDPRNTEHIVSWFHEVLQNRKPAYQEFDDGHMKITPQMSRVKLVQYDQNDELEAKYEVFIETTLDNKQAKNPKKWLVKINLYNAEHPHDKDLYHTIEWPRQPEEDLNWKGLTAGVARRNIFGVLRK